MQKSVSGSARTSDVCDVKIVGKHFLEDIAPRGVFEIVLRDKNGFIKEVRITKNGIPNAGLAAIASRIGGSGGAAAGTYIAVGTGTNAFNASDTALQTEVTTSGLGRANATMSLVTTNVTNDTSQALYQFSVSGTVAVTEAGIFNAASSGTLFARSVFSAINVANGDTLQITYKIVVA